MNNVVRRRADIFVDVYGDDDNDDANGGEDDDANDDDNDDVNDDDNDGVEEE